MLLSLLDIDSYKTSNFDFKYDFNSDSAVPLFIPDPIPLIPWATQNAAGVDAGVLVKLRSKRKPNGAPLPFYWQNVTGE